MSKTKLISIIIPVYNTEIYLRECIDSILQQTYSNLELIIINDGSVDNSLQIIKSYEQRDDRIKIIDKKNAGVSSARNDGLDYTSGEYIMFIDSDDYITDQNMIERIVESINNNCQPDIIMYKFVSDQNDYEPSENASDITDDLLKDMVANETINSACNKVYKNEIIKNAGIVFHTAIRMGEDLLFNIEYFKNSDRILILDQASYFRRVDDINSATKKYMDNKYNDLMYVNNQMIKWAEATNKIGLLSAAKYIRVKNIVSCIKDLHHADCPMTTLEKMITIERYKRENRRIIVKDCSIKIFIISLIYSLSSVNMLYRLTKLLVPRSAK